MQSKAKTVKEYLKELPLERKEAIEAVRKVILKNLPKGYEETMGYGMINYVVPLKVFPEGYLGQKNVPLGYAALASQKNHMAIYLFSIYGDKKSQGWFHTAYKKTGKRYDVGKSCVRFRKLDDLPLDLIGEAVSKWPMRKNIEIYKKYHNRKG
jgi:hypothetical protein